MQCKQKRNSSGRSAIGVLVAVVIGVILIRGVGFPSAAWAAEPGGPTGRLASEGEDPALEGKNYQAAVQMLKSENYEVAKTLLDAARLEFPDSLAVLSASAFCARKLEDMASAASYLKQTLRLAPAMPNKSEADERRVAMAQKALAEIEPVSEILYRHALQLRDEAEALEGPARERILSVSETMMDEALGAMGPEGRERLAQRALDRAKKLKSLGQYKEALGLLEAVDTTGIEAETKKMIEALGRLVSRSIEEEERFRRAARAWNEYVDYREANMDDVVGRRRKLNAILDDIRGTEHPKTKKVLEYVVDEIKYIEQGRYMEKNP